MTGIGIDWPPYYLDLKPCDFFFWGYLKDTVYSKNPQTLEQLEQLICETCIYFCRDIARSDFELYPSAVSCYCWERWSHWNHCYVISSLFRKHTSICYLSDIAVWLQYPMMSSLQIISANQSIINFRPICPTYQLFHLSVSHCFVDMSFQIWGVLSETFCIFNFSSSFILNLWLLFYENV